MPTTWEASVWQAMRNASVSLPTDQKTATRPVVHVPHEVFRMNMSLNSRSIAVKHAS